jgi:trehalose/maltose transport system substrate-binding protein
VQALYKDADVLAAAPFMAAWEEIFQNAVPRPSAPAQANYNEASSLFWSAVHNTLSGNGSAAENLEVLEADLSELLD